MKKIFLVTIILIICCSLFNMQLSAQERLHYWRDSETYLQDQASLIFEQAYKVLAAHPPGTNMDDERKLALFSIDALLHDIRLDNGIAFMSYIKRITGNVVTKLQTSKPSRREIRFFRLYNDGFVIQTPTLTIGIDLIKGGKADKPFISDTLMRSLVNQCDILFITHAHGDHADLSVVKMFCEQEKNVIAPEEIWKNIPPQFRVLRRSDMKPETIRLSAKNTSLAVRAYPGHQGDVLNNVYMITLPDGQTIAHMGDQDYTDDMVDKISRAVKIDVLLVHCWMGSVEKFVSTVKPALLITGHENEMGHSIDHREAYWLTFRRFSGIKLPYVIMSWGEFYSQ